MQANGHTRPTTGEPPTDHRRLTVAQAAREIGITEGAVRSRIKRGTLPVVKEGGTVYVVWSSSGTPPTDQPPYTGEPSSDPQASELVEALQEQVEYLRGQLNQEREAGRRKDHIIMSLTQRIPAIEPPETRPPQSPRDEPGQPEAASERADRAHVPPDPSSAAEGDIEGRYRSWWRRFFGL